MAAPAPPTEPTPASPSAAATPAAPEAEAEAETGARHLHALLDLEQHLALALEFLGGGTGPDAFAEDRRSFFAVDRCLEIAGRACRRLDPRFRAGTGIDWTELEASGDWYPDLPRGAAEAQVFRFVTQNVPAILDRVRDELTRVRPGHPGTD